MSAVIAFSIFGPTPSSTETGANNGLRSSGLLSVQQNLQGEPVRREANSQVRAFPLPPRRTIDNDPGTNETQAFYHDE